ncbi:MAG: hypothetical protein ACRDC7_09225 [Aeromonas veronii]
MTDVIDNLLTPEALDLVISAVTVGIQTPIGIGVMVVAGLGAVFLPKAQATKLMQGAKQLLNIKRK